jgi:hypothetical protein
VGALDQLRSATGDDGLVSRARSNPWVPIAIVGAAILILAWIGWAIHVASDDGGRAGLGVLIAWPAMLVAVGLISIPFIGGYLLIQRLSDGGSDAATAQADTSADEDVDEDEGEESEGSDEEAEDEDDGDEEADDDAESDPEPEAATS